MDNREPSKSSGDERCDHIYCSNRWLCISAENGLGRSLEYQLGGSLNCLEERLMVQIKAVSV